MIVIPSFACVLVTNYEKKSPILSSTTVTKESPTPGALKNYTSRNPKTKFSQKNTKVSQRAIDS